MKNQPIYTWDEASETVAKWATDYNAQTDTEMSIYPLEASNNIDSIKAIQINECAFERGEAHEAFFIVVWC